MKDTIFIKDDFCPEIEEVRQSALDSGFGTWRPNKGEIGSSIYTHVNYKGKHDLITRALECAVGRPVYQRTMGFRITKPDSEGAYIHSDREMGDWTCIVYLTEHKEVSGTGFYKHRETGMVEMPPLAELAKMPNYEKFKQEIVSGDAAAWEQTDFIRGHFNRALIFRSPLFHARIPKHGIGSGSDESGRMVYYTHFFL